MVLPGRLGLSRRHLQQVRSYRNRALPVLTGHRGDSDQRRAFGPCWRQQPCVGVPSNHRALRPPPCRPPSFRCAIGTPQRRCNPPPFATTYRDIAPGVTPGQRRGRHEVPPHAAPATTRGLYPRMGRSRHRTSGPRQRAIAAGASRLSRIREAPALPGMGSDQRTRQHCSPRYRHWPLPEEADCSSCTDRGETGSCFALSSDVQWQGWSPATPARTGPDIGTSAQFASPPKPLPL
jgi:hypothetical protein